MPGVEASGSTKIALLDSKIVADLCLGKFYIDTTPTVWIGSGKTTVLGANVQITNPYGVIVKPYGSNYEIAPALSGGMDAVISFNIPTQASNYQYGQYKVDVKMFDDSGSYVVTKTISICEPDKKNKTRNYGSLSAQLKGVCKDGKMYVIVDSVPTYKGEVVESQSQEFTLLYPTVSEKDPEVTSLGQFTVLLFEGEYKITGEICATYSFGDNLYVKVKYKVKKQKEIRCQLDTCCVLTALVALNEQINSDCTDEEKNKTASITVDALRLLRMAELAGECGEDASDYITELEKLLGCKCTCNCLEGAPIIPSAESSTEVIVEGCNVETSTAGLTTTYTINNYEYVVSITPNGGALLVTSATLADCTMTQVITFDISVVYGQIYALANSDLNEAAAWAAVINKVLAGLNPSCLGISGTIWDGYTFAQKFAAVFTKMCACCGCGAEITLGTITNAAANVTVPWTENDDVFSVDAYLDGVLKATVLAGVETYTFIGAADGTKHRYTLIAKCSDGSVGNTLTGQFGYLGCPEIATPSYGTDGVSGVTCPYDLTALSLITGSGITIEWHITNDSLPGSLLSSPSAVSDGIYYAFGKNADGCYSAVGMAFQVLCSTGDSCTAPQNLEIIEFGGSSHLVRFQSAAFPPPGNSYTVKRRLFSDPDVSGSYTTLGSPTWNVGMARWVLDDTTALNNVLYYYKVQSNCGDSPQSTPSVANKYIYFTCPSVTLTPGVEEVDYSFAPLGGSVNKYEVEIYDASGTTLIHTDTHLPSFSNPITGTFTYLTDQTDYLIRVRVWNAETESSQTCDFQSVTTTAP